MFFLRQIVRSVLRITQGLVHKRLGGVLIDLHQPKQNKTEFYFPYCVYVELSVLVEVIRVYLMYRNDAVQFFV